MYAALLLIDLQNDFLECRGLFPEIARLIPRVERLLAGFRLGKLPVFHVRTIVKRDGSDRMPHWKARGHWACVEGTRGSLPPDALAPADHEAVIRKHFYSGFESGELQQALQSNGVDTVILAGVYTHGCIRSTALDAYALGYAVWIAEDCVASAEQAHAQVSRRWLSERAMPFSPSLRILKELELAAEPAGRETNAPAPAAHFGGLWRDARDLPRWRHFNPADSGELLTEVPCADAGLVDAAVQTASQAQADWANSSVATRLQALGAWAKALEAGLDEFMRLMMREIGKPLTDAKEEMHRAIAHIAATVRLLESVPDQGGPASKHFSVYGRPLGTIAIITPWNNPLAIPAGKIAPALAFGNGIVWKPALPTSRIAMALIESLNQAGFPPSLIAVLFGDGETAQAIIAHPKTSAVSFTGSTKAGDQVASLCGLLRKPLQGEFGGNNAAIVSEDADLDLAAKSISASAFSFAGQRCTATRRIIVEASIRDAFLKRLRSEVGRLILGEPADPATQVGPLISDAHRNRVMAAVAHSLTADRGRLLCGGAVPPGWSHGNWYLPTLIDRIAPEAPIVQEETFGPVAVIETAAGFEHALQLCNGVRQGLVASVFTRDEGLQRRFALAAQAGLLRINPETFPVHPDAPFLGWKASGVGPPEHGRWDLEFYTRPQVVYGAIAKLR